MIYTLLIYGLGIGDIYTLLINGLGIGDIYTLLIYGLEIVGYLKIYPNRHNGVSSLT